MDVCRAVSDATIGVLVDASRGGLIADTIECKVKQRSRPSINVLRKEFSSITAGWFILS